MKDENITDLDKIFFTISSDKGQRGGIGDGSKSRTKYGA